MKSKSSHFSRRNLLKLGSMAVGTVMFSQVALPQASAQELLASVPENLTPDEALELLMSGNKRFVKQQRQTPNQTKSRLKEVAYEQKPFASILSCADSRVPVEILFDRGFGDLFVVRQAGNLVTPEETGSLEFGTLVLGSKVLMVMGHKGCGAVKSTMQGAAVPGQIGSLLEAIKPSLDRAKGLPGDPLENAIKANVLYQVEKLQASPVISELVAAGKLKVVGAYYALDTGEVTLLS